ncbi:MAG: ATP-binding protein [Candidatus Dormibacterales bacterium]
MPPRAGVGLTEALAASAGRIATLGPDLERICAEVVRACVEEVAASAVWCGRAEPDGSVVLVAGAPPQDPYLAGLQVRWDESPLGRGPAGTALRTGEVVVQHRLAADRSFGPWREAAATRGLRSSVCLPLISHEGVYGLLVLYSARRAFFTPTRVAGLRLYAGQVAAALQSARLKAELAASTERFHAIVDQAPVGVMLAGAGGEVLQVNAALCSMSGYSKEELTTGGLDALTHPDERESSRQAWAEASRDGEPVVARSRLVRRDGSVLEAVLTVSPFHDVAGAYAGRLVTAQDVTELRRAERKLAESSARLEAALRQPGLTVYALDAGGRLTFIRGGGAAGVEDSGYQGVEGRSVFEVFADEPEVLEVVKGALAGETRDAVLHLRRSGRVFDSHTAPLLDGEGQVTGAMGVALDVTEARRSELELVATAARLQALLAAAPVLLFVLEADGTVEMSAGTGLGSMGSAAGPDPGRNFIDACVGEPEIAEVARRALAGELVGADVHVSATDRDLELIGSPMTGEDGAVTQVLIVGTDVTEQRRMAIAQAQNEAKSRFLANMSHEFRTPLNSVLGFAQLLAGGLGGPLNEQQLRYVENINSSGRHLLALVNDTLDLSKVQAGKMDLRLEDVGLAEAVELVVSRLQPLAAEKGLDLAVQLARGWRLRANTDRLRLEQVLSNLLSNAIKFTPPGGRVEVGVVPVPEGAELYVEDTGIGIAPGDLESIFDEFTQLDSSTHRQQNGTGLGLSLAKGLVELMGGRISVTSELGRGSRFAVVLPRRPPRAEPG